MRERVIVDTEHGKFVVDKQDFMKYQRNYLAMYDKLINEIGDTDRIKYIMFTFDDSVNGITIGFHTNRCTLFSTKETFMPNHENDNEVLSNAIAAWMKLPLQESDKEQYTGIWKERGKKISFNRIWNDYRFSDEQCVQLLEGKHIQFEAAGRNGETRTYCGIITEQEFNGFRFFGFQLDGWAIPKEWKGHIITDAERDALAAGREVYLTNVYSAKKHTFYNAYFTYDIKNGIKLNRFD